MESLLSFARDNTCCSTFDQRFVSPLVSAITVEEEMTATGVKCFLLSQETNEYVITHNRASGASAHLEAAAQRFFMDTAEGIHEQNDEGFVDGVAVGAEGDTPADTLEGLRACDLCQSLP